MQTTINNASATADREISATRVFDAPRELVWKVWTEPEHIAKWWGPDGFTNTVHKMNVRPGGVFSLTMHGPDGTDYPNRIIFIEIIKPKLLVYTHNSGKENDPGQFEVTVNFDAEGGKTKLSMRAIFKTKEMRDFHAEKYGAIEGMHQHLGRLKEYLTKM